MMTIDDLLAFEAWPEDRKRIARAAVEFEQLIGERMEERLKSERENSFAEGYAAAVADAKTGDAVSAGVVHQLLDRLQLFRQSIATNDSRYATLGEIIADMAQALEP